MRRTLYALVCMACIVLCASCVVPKKALSPVFDRSQSLYVDTEHNDIRHVLPVLADRAREHALLIAQFPMAAWFTRGTPDEVREQVNALVNSADAHQQLPVLVAYNLPFRDCQQYSSGGAADSTAYRVWIDGFAAGIGNRRAIVILEPDGLGIIPHYTDLQGNAEWCQPQELDANNAANERFAQLRYAVEKLTALPNAFVYLDGTHSQWLPVGDSAYRLSQAGVEFARGFFLNVSNYHPTADQVRYGEWVAKCIYYAAQASSGHNSQRFAECASYLPTRDEGSAEATDAWYRRNIHMSRAARSLKNFVIDTSRNGRGGWRATEGRYSDPQAWCNPPGRGLGERPTLQTGHLLVDAKLWIKIPGESDGQCMRGEPGTVDPEWRIPNPPAGKWFKEQAAELIELAVPPL